MSKHTGRILSKRGLPTQSSIRFSRPWAIFAFFAAIQMTVWTRTFVFTPRTGIDCSSVGTTKMQVKKLLDSDTKKKKDGDTGESGQGLHVDDVLRRLEKYTVPNTMKCAQMSGKWILKYIAPSGCDSVQSHIFGLPEKTQVKRKMIDIQSDGSIAGSLDVVMPDGTNRDLNYASKLVPQGPTTLIERITHVTATRPGALTPEDVPNPVREWRVTFVDNDFFLFRDEIGMVQLLQRA